MTGSSTSTFRGWADAIHRHANRFAGERIPCRRGRKEKWRTSAGVHLLRGWQTMAESMDADSTVEYIRELITADSVWAKKYHNIGAGNRRKGRALLDPNRQGGRATVGELSDFMTEHVVGPGTRGSSYTPHSVYATQK